MAKGKKPANPSPQAALGPSSMRAQLTGKSRDKGPPRNSKGMLKLDHLRRLAEWAGGEGSVPSLGALFGRQFAAAGENLGLAPEPSMVPCQRCETILQPGFNCTVRIEKNRSKTKRKGKRSKANHAEPQNNVVYTCHFCSFRNLKRGTPKGHVKGISPPKPKPCPAKPVASTNPIIHKEATTSSKNNSETMKVVEVARPAIPEDVPLANSQTTKVDEVAMPATPEDAPMVNSQTMKVNEVTLPAVPEDAPMANSPKTPLGGSAGATPLLEALRKKRNRSKAKKKPEESESGIAVDTEASVSSSRKKRRKSWTSLKEIAESNEKDAKKKLMPKFVIPLSL